MAQGRRVAEETSGRRPKRRRVWGYWVVILLLLAVCAGLTVQTIGTVQVNRWERRQYVAAFAEHAYNAEQYIQDVLDGNTDSLAPLDSELASLEELANGNYCLWYNILNQLHSFTEDTGDCSGDFSAVRSRYSAIAEGLYAGGELTEKGAGFLEDLQDTCRDFRAAAGYSADSGEIGTDLLNQNAFTAACRAFSKSLASLAG